MSADPRVVGSYLSKGASALASAAPAITALSGPGGAAVSIVAMLAGIAGDVMQGSQTPVTLAQDPGDLLQAMHAHWAAKKAATATPSSGVAP